MLIIPALWVGRGKGIGSSRSFSVHTDPVSRTKDTKPSKAQSILITFYMYSQPALS